MTKPAAIFRKHDSVTFGSKNTAGIVIADHGKHGNGRRVIEVLTIDGRTAMPFDDECAIVRRRNPGIVDITPESAARVRAYAEAR